jgi:thiol-disulfide isomerase/thioredoxin
MHISTLRQRPLLLALVATAVALVAAVLAGVTVAAVTHEAKPKVEATLHLTPPDQEPQPVVEGDESGKTFPVTSMAKLAGGLGSLADYKGKPVVVNFFASSCGACITEMPALQKVHRELGDKVVFVGIDVRDPQKDGEAFVRRTGASYDILRDPSGKVTSDVGVINLPATFLLSPSGRIVVAHPGAISEGDLRSELAKHFTIS